MARSRTRRSLARAAWASPRKLCRRHPLHRRRLWLIRESEGSPHRLSILQNNISIVNGHRLDLKILGLGLGLGLNLAGPASGP